MCEAKPFLRWAGGKRWLLKDINDLLPLEDFKQYHEPFLGGGAVFFHLQAKESYLSDLNSELIDTYSAIKNDPELVIRYLKEFKNTKDEYYKLRKTNFRSSARNAAKFIYLNRTSFNGIYRVNLQGEYNVPYGYRKNIEYNYENIRKVSEQLKQTKLNACDYYETLDNINEGDLVFLDPPYTVTHNNNGFIKYNSKIFSIEEQYRLCQYIQELKDIGAYYILTNAAHPKIVEIFNLDDNVYEIDRQSVIGGKNAVRGLYTELIITNGL